MSDEDAFSAFVREQSGSLFRTAFLLTGSRAAAEDLLQETLTRLYPQWNRVVGATSPVAYVRRCLGNTFVSSVRRRAVHDPAAWELPDGWDVPGDADPAEAVADRALIWQLLGGLPLRQRAAVVMRHYHDLSDDEIAASLDCRPVTVRSLLSRAVTSMRADLSRQRNTAGCEETSR